MYRLWGEGRGAPLEVYHLKEHCDEYGLDYQAMRNVVRGRIKSHRGWSLDAERTAKFDARVAEVAAMIDNGGVTIRLLVGGVPRTVHIVP
jgi:hypothetical protein